MRTNLTPTAGQTTLGRANNLATGLDTIGSRYENAVSRFS